MKSLVKFVIHTPKGYP